MKNKFIAIAITGLLTATAFADSASTTKKPLTIQHRKHNQQARIHQGVKSGELTHHEAKHLEKQEHALNKEEREMRKENGGKLTAADRAKLNRQQNHLSKEIYKDKHNNKKRG
jgi:hypothetical protein